MFRTLWGCIFLLLVSSHANGQDPYYFNFNTEHGLPSSEVYSVGFDEYGMPWFATDRGVCRYNGYEFSTYTTHEGLANNTCLDIHKGPDGKLWFLGLDGSISFLENGKLKPFPGNDQLFDLVGNQLIYGMAWEGEAKMYVWCYEAELQVLCYDFDTGVFEKMDLEEEAFQKRKKKVGELTFYAIGGAMISTYRIVSNVALSGETLFHDTSHDLGMLYKGKLEDPDDSERRNLEVKIHSLYIDDFQDLLIATSSGIFIYPEGDLSVEPQILFPEVSFSSVVKDMEGNFWLTTLEKGIFWVPSFDFHRVQLPGGDAQSSTISSLIALENHLFFGSMEGRMYAIDKNMDTELLFGSNGAFGRLSYAVKNAGHAYIGTYEVREEQGKPRVGDEVGWHRNPVTIELANSDILLGTKYGFLVYNDGEMNADFRSGIPFRIHSATELGNRVYLGTLKGLWCIEDYDYSAPRLIRIGSNGDQLRINDLEKDDFGNVWVASIGEGLTYLAGEEQYHIGVVDGLNSNMINRVAAGVPGVVYVATNAGVNRVDYAWENGLKIKSVKGINSDEGLPGNFVQDVAFWNGYLWMATHEGLAYCAPEMFDERDLPRIPILLEEVSVNRKVMEDSRSAELNHDENDLAIHFLGMSMRKPKNAPFYRYRLQQEGSSVPWEYTNDRAVRYMNLAPGAYTFEVAAQNRNEQWSAEAATYSFVIHPHFSNTIWFQSLVVLFLLGLLVGLAYLSLRRVRQKAAQKRSLQEARLKAQEAEITALRNQMNPHFVFNALNSIQNFIFKNDIRQANFYLSKFSKLMRDGLQFSRKKLISLQEEVTFIKAYLDLETMRFPGRFSYAVEVEEGLEPGRVMVPPFLFQPLLENAVKHAFKDIDYPGELRVSFKKRGGELLSVEIMDNGPGFDWSESPPPEKGHRSMGLQIVQDRIALLNAERHENKARFEMTNLKSEGQKGMRARFFIPINIKDHG